MNNRIATYTLVIRTSAYTAFISLPIPVNYTLRNGTFFALNAWPCFISVNHCELSRYPAQEKLSRRNEEAILTTWILCTLIVDYELLDCEIESSCGYKNIFHVVEIFYCCQSLRWEMPHILTYILKFLHICCLKRKR